MAWNASSLGKITTKSAYVLVRGKKALPLICTSIWSSTVPKKFFFLEWRIINNLLPIEINLQKRDVAWASKCCFCPALETLEHVFLYCHRVRQAWAHFHTAFGIPLVEHPRFGALVMQWAFSMPNDSLEHIRSGMPVIIAWFIWYVRKQTRFEGFLDSSVSLIYKIQEFLQLMELAGIIWMTNCTGDERVYLHPWMFLGRLHRQDLSSSIQMIQW